MSDANQLVDSGASKPSSDKPAPVAASTGDSGAGGAGEGTDGQRKPGGRSNRGGGGGGGGRGWGRGRYSGGERRGNGGGNRTGEPRNSEGNANNQETGDSVRSGDNRDGQAQGTATGEGGETEHSRGGRGGGRGGGRRYRPRRAAGDQQANENDDNRGGGDREAGQPTEGGGEGNRTGDDRPPRRRRRYGRGPRELRTSENGGDVKTGDGDGGGEPAEPGQERRHRRGGGRGRGGRGGAGGGGNNRSTFRRFTHFISIPLNLSPIQENYDQFKANVLAQCSATTDEADVQNLITEDLFQNKAKIHLTFGIMNLKDEEEEKTACDLLAKCKENIVSPILNGQPLKVDVKGVDTLTLKNGKSRVLFAKLGDGADKVQAIADQVVAVFAENGIMDRDRETVTLHITLMNTTFRERLFRKQPKYWTLKRPARYFDPTPILEQFKDFVFAEGVTIGGLHISSAAKYGEDGFYLPLVKVDF